MLKACLCFFLTILILSPSVYASPEDTQEGNCNSFLSENDDLKPMADELFRHIYAFELFRRRRDSRGDVPDFLMSYFGVGIFSEPVVRLDSKDKITSVTWLSEPQLHKITKWLTGA